MLGSGMVKPSIAKPQSSPLRESPKRPRSSSSSERESTPPSTKQPRLASPKVSQPLASSEKRKTPERRPSSTSVSSLSSTSPAIVTSRASLMPPHFPPHMLPPGYPGFPTPLPPRCQGHPCVNPRCADLSCPTGAARASFLMGVPPPSLLNMLPPSTGAAGTSPYVCNWMSNGEFCGRRFNSSEDLMGHLRTHTSSVSPAPPPTSLAALQQAQAAALISSAAASTTTTSALAALQAQAAKISNPPPTSSADLAAAAAARYHAALVTRPGLPPPLGLAPAGIPPIPPHLASLYGLGNPYSLPMLYPMP